MAKLGWIFGPGSCASFDVRAALEGDLASEVRRVACGPTTATCECPVQRVLWGYDATPVLRRFACEAALGVAHLWDPPPVVLRYLKTGDESIREAARLDTERNPPQPDTTGGASSVAWAAAVAATYRSPRSAATIAARDAAWAAAATPPVSQSAVKAAEVAAWKRQSRRLERLLNSGRKLYSQRSMP